MDVQGGHKWLVAIFRGYFPHQVPSKNLLDECRRAHRGIKVRKESKQVKGNAWKSMSELIS